MGFAAEGSLHPAGLKVSYGSHELGTHMKRVHCIAKKDDKIEFRLG